MAEICRQALEDGVLIDVSATARELGVKIPVAVTSAVWPCYVKLTPAAIRAGNGEQGRLWDILWMFRWAAIRAKDKSEVLFQLHVVTHCITPSLVELKALCGPGDECEAVITIMLPEEDLPEQEPCTLPRIRPEARRAVGWKG
ncbi:DUF6573 family protein [Sorangium sp. So ce1099]|uniref:DUF6573 family protein n=1 Tax=Sorangium sp. So ce1099 TaxID=3133331 RepID=UPI003F5DCFAC